MRALTLAVVVACATVASADGERRIAVLASPGDARRERVLVDALRIYTRDLGASVRVAGAAPGPLDAGVIARVAAQAHADGDEIVVWLAVRDGAPVLLALRAATGELRETAVERDEPLRTARTLALKVRALLTTSATTPDWSVPPEAATPAPSATPPAAPSAPAPASPPPSAPAPASPPPSAPSPASPPPSAPAPAAPPVSSVPAPAAPTVSSSAPSAVSAPSPGARAAAAARSPPPAAVTVRRAPPPGGDRVELHAEYGVIVPTSPAWLRHGLMVRVAVPLGRRPLALFADTAFTTAPSMTLDSSTLSARVWPVAVGLALRLRRARWQLSGGPRASLQIIDADAHAADGRVAAMRLYAAGVGLLGDVRWLVWRNVALVASISAEALVPRVQLTAGGAGASDLGWVQLGASAGAVFSVP